MRRLRVLVVEDEELARERLARLIAEQSGFELAAACGNCDEALGVLAVEAVDIALLDIQMPGISGMEFSARLGEHSELVQNAFENRMPSFAIRSMLGVR